MRSTASVPAGPEELELTVKVAFSCDHCQAPFLVDAALAGRTGRCRYCGHRMVVPAQSTREGSMLGAGQQGAAAAVAAAVGAKRVRRRRVAASPRRQAVSAAARPATWREAVASQMGLKPAQDEAAPVAARPQQAQSELDELSSSYDLRPMSKDSLPMVRRKELEPEEEEAGSTYKIVIPREIRKEIEGHSQLPVALRKGYAGSVKSYRRLFDMAAKLSGSVSNLSYSLSLALFILALAGVLSNRHSLAIFGLSAIVLLNLVGMAGDAVNLVMLSFRKNPVRGALFLVPPITILYLFWDWDRYRETVNRLLVPVAMLCLVVAAYIGLPWLNGGRPEPATLQERVERAVQNIPTDVGRSTAELRQKAAGAARELPGQIKAAEKKMRDAAETAGRKFEAAKQRRAAQPP